MGALVRRRLRAPVLGRLAWAWLALGVAGAGLCAYAIFDSARSKNERIALPVASEMERLAPPVETNSVLKTAARAPARADDDFAPETDDVFAGDGLAVLEQPPLAIEEPEGAIVITIDGARPRATSAPATGAALVSASGPAIKIPDADPALLLKTSLGARPKIAADGRRAAHVYARPFSSENRKAKVALIVGGLGLNPSLTARAIDELPPEVTLAFAPYAKDLETWTKRARDKGHEIMIELPMEAHGGDPATLGPAALLTGRSNAENVQRLDWLLARFGGYFGATNYLGSKFSADREAMNAVLVHLASSGIAYVDDTGAAHRVGASGAPLAVVNRMVSPGADGADKATALRDLKALAAAAGRSGDALGKAYAYDATIDAILAFTAEMDRDALALAPASAVVHGRAADL